MKLSLHWTSIGLIGDDPEMPMPAQAAAVNSCPEGAVSHAQVRRTGTPS